METTFFEKVSSFLKKHRRYKHWQKAVMCMSAIVVFATTYMLILPAITMEQEYVCEKEEHVHTDECYEKVLICEESEIRSIQETDSGKTEAEEAGNEGGEAGDVAQASDENNAEGTGEQQPEDPSGTEQTESEQPEKESSTEVSEGHVHTDECYETRLACTKEEHEHILQCYSNPEADVETAGVWERTIPDRLSGEWAADVTAVAESQLGYTESTRNYQVDGTNTIKGYTRYGAWYGEAYGDWDAMFVSFCLNYAGISEKDFPRESDSSRWAELLAEEKYNLYTEAGDYEPRTGDLIFFDTDKTDEAADSEGSTVKADHVGLVEAVISGTDQKAAQVKVIEGDADNKVQIRTYDLTNRSISGYGQLPGQTFSCGQTGHVHTVYCKDDSGNLICGKEEHIHTEECEIWTEEQGQEEQGQEEQNPEEETTTEEETEEETTAEEVTEEETTAEEVTEEKTTEEETEAEETTGEGTAAEQSEEETSGESTETAEEETSGEVSKTEDNAFPAELPEGYEKYTFDGQDGLSAVVYAPENAFNGQKVTLKVEKLNEDSKAYTEVKAELDAAEDVEYDGFAALDIHFENEEGEEAEPDSAAGRVYVKLNASALLPEDIDQDSVSVQHHLGEADSSAADTGNAIQTVADQNDDTGNVEVVSSEQAESQSSSEAESISMLDVEAEFAVESFSVFTVTWQKDGVTATLRIHYVDENGTEFVASIENNFNDPRKEHDRIHSDAYAQNFTGEGYTYVGAYTSPTGGHKVDYVTYVFSGTDEGFRCSVEGETGWDFLGIGGNPGVKGAREADLYLRYKRIVVEEENPVKVGTTFTPNSQNAEGQIVNSGGTNTSTAGDDVSVSKTIEKTDIENVFDITLNVKTKTKLEELEKAQSVDVVIVMDVSNTMRYCFGGTNTQEHDTWPDRFEESRYAAAMTAAENFVRQFQQASAGLNVDRRIGFVTFNTHGKRQFTLTQCESEEDATQIINQIRTKSENIITADGYTSNHARFTNMEAGLYEAELLLKESQANNKYVIFLTDGFPTTFGLGENKGIDPYDKNGIVFKNRRTGKNCGYGTSYSDQAAYYAENHAADVKNNANAKIFALGVDIGGQTISAYEKEVDGYSLIDCFSEGDSRLRGNKYMIGYNADDFKNWLKTYISSGTDYYYSTDNAAQLYNAFNNIFETIKTQSKYAIEASWVAEDPINSGEGSDYIEFIQFFNKAGTLAGASLAGEKGADKENTAIWNKEKDTISWDLKKSGYTTSETGNTTYYTYSLKYRVRLENEKAGFVDSTSYQTNGTTSLTYREINNDVPGPLKSIEFPIPEVKGYLENLTFTKVSSTTQNPLAGAKFTLTHSAKCTKCHGDDKAVKLDTYEAISNGQGKVSFTNIPSGHDYILKEVEAPTGYYLPDDQYAVTVRYNEGHTDAVITVKDSGGNVVDLSNMQISNIPQFALPATGGKGVRWYTLGGLLLIAAALLTYIYKRRKVA